jgi:SAM-dependent methyltransferase
VSSGFQLARAQADLYERFTRTFMDGSAELIVLAAGIAAGDVVLDLACGPGLVARHALPLVGATGRVVGADINPGMLSVAQEALGDAVEWVAAPCDALPFDDGTFTHVLCQQGFQFFPDLGAATVEAARVLQPGGHLLATIWATPGQTPYIEHQLSLLASIDPSLGVSLQRATPPNADAMLVAAARAAGFADAETTVLEHVVIIDDFGPWFLGQTSSTPWGPALSALDETGRRTLVDAMVARLQDYATGDGTFHVPFRSHLLHAHR